MRQFIRAIAAALVATVLVVPVSTHQTHAAGRSGAAPSGGALPDGLAPVLQRELTASDGKSPDYFGWSVAVSGNTAVIAAVSKNIGVDQNEGAVYVFVRSRGTWLQQAELTAGDGAANDNFGSAVAVSGDTIVIGADCKNNCAGAAYVFVRSGGTWLQQAELTAGDGGATDFFGLSVAMSADTIVVGAPGKNVGANQYQGAAYVFRRGEGAWILKQELVAADGLANDSLGNSVAIRGDTIVVGDPFKAVGANLSQGTAYVFARSAGTWAQQQELTAGDGALNDNFGLSVAVSADTIVVGAPVKKLGASGMYGVAYVFARGGNTWGQQAELTAGDGAASGNFPFGWSVGVSGDTVVVGAPTESVGANSGQGAAFKFTRGGGTWSQRQELTASDGNVGDSFGWSVAVKGDTAIVGAPTMQFGGVQTGAAYTFKVPSGNPED